MASAQERVMQAMKACGEATRPQLASATGLSLVMVNQVVATLCRQGVLQAEAQVPSGGGRPAQQYKLNSGSKFYALIRLWRNDKLLHARTEELNLSGTPTRHMEADFAYVDIESFDNWLDKLAHSHRLSGITLCTDEEIKREETIAHLQKRYHCVVQSPTTAALLCEHKEGSTTLILPQGQEASCAHYSNGKIQESGALNLLPLPATWAGIDYEDRALVVDTVSRLLQIIICIQRPTRVILHAPAWSPRLVERIRYNVSAKLKDKLPPLRFVNLTENAQAESMRKFAVGIS
ncbi:MAG: hypothetical protein IJB64_03545 [Akkermansia sp.]|nr:hypothetical protein [Akkermansia sp.]